MKKNGFYYMGLFTAMSVGVLASSCSNDDFDSSLDPNPTGESVKTTFAISVPAGTTGGASSRMSENIVQANNKFRGLQNIYLMSYGEAPTSGAITLTKSIKLSDFDKDDNDFNAYGNITGTGNDAANGGYKLYSNVDIPVGTQNFLFYANALRGNGATGFTDGTLTANELATTTTSSSDISFSPVLVIGNNTGSLTTDENTITAYLKAIAGVSGWSTTNDQTLARLYGNLISMKAGSATSIKYFLKGLYTELITFTATSSSASVSDKEIGTAIMDKMKSFTTETTPSITITLSVEENTQTGDLTFTWSETFPNIPEKYDLPQGCLSLSFNSTNGTFSYNQFVSTNPRLTFENICYPAELYYYVNSPVRACTNDEVVWPDELTKWYDTNNTYWANGSYTWGTKVEASTKTVALKNPVNYGVAQLQTTVKCVNEATLKDNRDGYINGETAQDITIPSNGFPITGILVGGQPSKVDYSFLPPSTSVTYDQVIYDKNIATTVDENDNVINMAAERNKAVGTNYTLVLDNNNGSGQQKVSIAIELQNNTGGPFYGVDGIVAPGQKFYLIGVLDPASDSVTGDNNSNNPNKVTRVFLKDYVTKANFTISSLKNAYVNIPDLSASQLQLGLAVDLYWQAGMTFDVTIP